ncbi:hypothetical protein [Mucilaginibacter arboris]|uniref:Uncharacterized protein n=1 Tax=Mucilaginibacter arboris TaxID=2682090 RepID=A0A7K1T043_9SPHI|nr:hypothetical protein [Mucilaginibacter arboris]MVN22888.1 hypothetical protein [Mucilaginibacter arboris]
MKTILTKRLLGFLIKKGYKYCLSKTSFIDQQDAPHIGIMLKPVKKHPLLQKLPKPYENYFTITREPLEMASGTSDAQVIVELSEKDYQKFALA